VTSVDGDEEVIMSARLEIADRDHGEGVFVYDRWHFYRNNIIMFDEERKKSPNGLTQFSYNRIKYSHVVIYFATRTSFPSRFPQRVVRRRNFV